MYAESNNTDLHFKNLCGVLAITVKDHQMTQVKKIRVSNSDKLMFGTFKVNADGAMQLIDPVDPSQAVELRRRQLIFEEPVPVLEQSKVFYIALAPQSYKNLVVEISEDGETFPYRNGARGTIDIERNNIYPVTFTVQTTGQTLARISGHYENVPWVILWPGGTKWAKFNVGVTDANPKSAGPFYTHQSPDDVSDLATKEWGDNWRTPTKQEYEDLLANCDYRIFTENNKTYVEFKGRGLYSSNSIIFPAAGSLNTSGSHSWDNDCWYWSATKVNDELYYAFSAMTSWSNPCRINNFVYNASCSLRAIVK